MTFLSGAGDVASIEDSTASGFSRPDKYWICRLWSSVRFFEDFLRGRDQAKGSEYLRGETRL